MYESNCTLFFREGNRQLEVVETYDQVKALIDAVGTKKHIEVTVTRIDTQYLSPTPNNTKAEQKKVTVKNLVLVENLALVQPKTAAPTTF
jgi:hypothetical protein